MVKKTETQKGGKQGIEKNRKMVDSWGIEY
jgi:hypothetical protein